MRAAIIAASRRAQMAALTTPALYADEKRRLCMQAEPLLEVWKAIISHKAAAPFRSDAPSDPPRPESPSTSRLPPTWRR
eukprot:7645028-Pyramimonas_sp.AAC.1